MSERVICDVTNSASGANPGPSFSEQQTWKPHSEAGDISSPTVKTWRNICTFMNSERLGTSFCLQNVLKWKYKVKVPQNVLLLSIMLYSITGRTLVSPLWELSLYQEGAETHSLPLFWLRVFLPLAGNDCGAEERGVLLHRGAARSRSSTWWWAPAARAAPGSSLTLMHSSGWSLLWCRGTRLRLWL